MRCVPCDVADCRWRAKNSEMGTSPLFRPSNKHSNGDIGTEDAFTNAISCCAKGCYTSAFTFAESYKLLRRTELLGLPIYSAIGHTGKNEALHSSINRLLDHLSHIGADHMHKRLMLELFFYNRRRDIDRNMCREDAPYPPYSIAHWRIATPSAIT
jgi:hypothetical protein